MKKETAITNEEKATKRSIELERCRKAAIRQSKIKGHSVYVPESRCSVFVKDDEDEDVVIKRHLKHYRKQREIKYVRIFM